MDNYDALMNFGLTHQEAVLYVALITEGTLTGYEASKRTGISRSNAYTALAALADKGAACIASGTPVKYTPVPVEEFCTGKLKYMSLLAQKLKDSLPSTRNETDEYITIKGDRYIDDKIRYMLSNTRYRAYFSAESKVIERYREELQQMMDQGMKVVVITDQMMDLSEAIVYQTVRKPNEIGLIIDSSVVLTGEIGMGTQSSCLFSGKKNLVDLFKESLANEIKLIEITERNDIH